MSVIIESKRIQKRRTEEEMRTALHNFINGKWRMSIPPQIEDDDIVLSDVIKELLDARRTIEWFMKQPVCAHLLKNKDKA